MAKLKQSQWLGSGFIETVPKKTAQGNSKNTKHSATSRNKARKRYRGQGK
jgi:hypothetical protein